MSSLPGAAAELGPKPQRKRRSELELLTTPGGVGGRTRGTIEEESAWNLDYYSPSTTNVYEEENEPPQQPAKKRTKKRCCKRSNANLMKKILKHTNDNSLTADQKIAAIQAFCESAIVDDSCPLTESPARLDNVAGDGVEV